MLYFFLPLIGCTNFPESRSVSVPWFHQLDIPEIGWAACSSAASAMVLGYHGYIEDDSQSMILAAETIFAATSDPERGLLSRDGLAEFLVDEWGYTSVHFEYDTPAALYDLVRIELNEARPLILGTRSINSYGHYMVVTGYDGHRYDNASVLLNDPYGRWIGHDDWCATCSGKGVSQDFLTFAGNDTDGMFVLIP